MPAEHVGKAESPSAAPRPAAIELRGIEALFAEEVRRFPLNVRAHVGLAALYHTTGQTDLAASTITDMLRAAPTPESYTAAARLWTAFGRAREAQSVRAEARRTFSR